MSNRYEQTDFSQIPLANRVEPDSKPCYEFCKRLFDIVVSFLGMIILSPVFLVTAAVILFSDGGNPFYVSTRVTKDGKEFRMYKFRSMVKNADKMQKELEIHNEMKDGPAFKMTNDPRVTAVGRFIRKTSIDELPQLLNVFLGDMTLVGPRPPIPSEVERYTPYHMQRLGVKQGLTCYWQCSGRNDIGFDEWVELDLKYIRERSFVTDIKILFKTVGAVFSMRGAK